MYAIIFTIAIPIFPVLITMLIIELKSKNKENKSKNFFTSIKYNIMIISIILVVALICFFLICSFKSKIIYYE